ncbi:TPA: Arc family DNA-binding protein [Enterobacter asburiae]|nr:Arc family DNA-binding protein [Enterobacter asburiae]
MKVRDIAPYGVRMPAELKDKIQEKAKAHGRSMNAEIVQMLESSLSQRDEGEDGYSKEMSEHHQSLLKMKDEVIETQKETISHMENTINSLNEHINILKDHVDFLKNKYK